MISSRYEKVIDIGFWETPYIVIIFELGLVTNIWKFKIIGYEVGVGVNFQKMLSKKGSTFLRSKDMMSIYAYN
jgi:hypothetical protein